MRENDSRLIRPEDIAVALALLTRFPLPRIPDTAFARQASAVWAFGVAGAAIAVPAIALALIGLHLGLPAGLAAGLWLGLQVMLSGAMHQDGLADMADGLWGGWTAERRLEIMHDSRIGTYGVVALILVLGAMWQAGAAVLAQAPWALIAPAMLSRALLPAIMHMVPPARGDGLSRGVGRPGAAACSLALILAAVGSAAVVGALAIPVFLAMAALAWAIARIARIRLGGQTGDVLGAVQQITELGGTITLLLLL
ncbi:MAG: adenosylcobinamide-GDP ribazoletransferase [Rhodobacteraceae bacterium]|nr:adenosylcobinamide-GDP ribazoletransferase [Paracoccaceae bacterium]